jgi:hypothetical protein
MSCGLAAERCLARRVERIAANGEPSRMVWKFVRERLRGSERGNLSRSPLRRLPLALSTAEQHASRPPKLQTCDSLAARPTKASEAAAANRRFAPPPVASAQTTPLGPSRFTRGEADESERKRSESRALKCERLDHVIASWSRGPAVGGVPLHAHRDCE